MSLRCHFFGHVFKHEISGVKVDVTKCYGALSCVVERYEAIRVVKYCQRCGYEHADTFKIQGTEKPI